jgi:hypothetical protein
MGVVALLLTGCATTTVGGSAGCQAYAEARLSLTPLETITAETSETGEGKGLFKDKVFQVSNIGALSLAEVQFFLDSLKEILESSK